MPMPSLGTIGPAVWPSIKDKQTNRQTDKQTDRSGLLYRLAKSPALLGHPYTYHSIFSTHTYTQTNIHTDTHTHSAMSVVDEGENTLSF